MYPGDGCGGCERSDGEIGCTCESFGGYEWRELAGVVVAAVVVVEVVVVVAVLRG